MLKEIIFYQRLANERLHTLCLLGSVTGTNLKDYGSLLEKEVKSN